MTTHPIIATVLAVLCVLSIGVSATTLESSMQTNPDDVIDLDWDRLPIGEERAAELNREIQGKDEGEQSATSAGTGRELKSQLGSGDETEQSPGAGNGGERPAAQQEAPAGATEPPPRQPTDLLEMLLMAGIVLALAVFGYWYARRSEPDPDPEDEGSEASRWPPGEPMNEVDKAWYAMVRDLDLERPWTRTPREVAGAAVDVGMDPEAVEAVTTAFSDVRYGGADPTAAHRERARTALRHLEIDPDGDPA